MLQQVKAKSFEKKDLLTADEFKEIVGSRPAEGTSDAGLKQQTAKAWRRRRTHEESPVQTN